MDFTDKLIEAIIKTNAEVAKEDDNPFIFGMSSFPVTKNGVEDFYVMVTYMIDKSLYPSSESVSIKSLEKTGTPVDDDILDFYNTYKDMGAKFIKP
jgi:hypothetical protein